MGTYYRNLNVCYGDGSTVINNGHIKLENGYIDLSNVRGGPYGSTFIFDGEVTSWPPRLSGRAPSIRNVIFNPPATIIYWADGTKTVVKCGKNDAWDAEKGLAMAVAKKAMGNKGNYNKALKRWLEAAK